MPDNPEPSEEASDDGFLLKLNDTPGPSGAAAYKSIKPGDTEAEVSRFVNEYTNEWATDIDRATGELRKATDELNSRMGLQDFGESLRESFE